MSIYILCLSNDIFIIEFHNCDSLKFITNKQKQIEVFFGHALQYFFVSKLAEIMIY